MHERFIERLEHLLKEPLPGSAAHRRMEPRYSYGRHAGPAAYHAKPAAVAILLHPDPSGTWQLPLTVRPAHMKDHAGQICLPGGAVEGNEDRRACALREVEEELAPRPAPLRFLGELTPLYVFGTNFDVRPVVLAAEQPLTFDPDAREVSRVIPLPLAELLTAQPQTVRMPFHSLFCEAPAWCFGEACCWGATAMILAEFRELVADCAATGED